MYFNHHKNILIFSDNNFILDKIMLVISEKRLDKEYNFRYAASPGTSIQTNIESVVTRLKISETVEQLISQYDLIISAHCKQIFPETLVKSIKCINIHPGLNPYNRGWFPQVFSIINKLPVGVTIHEMDKDIDHGPIIAQKKIEVFSYDTSETIYNRILEQEIALFSQIVDSVLTNNYVTTAPCSEGNINWKKDFDDLCLIDLEKNYTGGEMIDLLRALSHGDYHNAYFYDRSGNKVYIKLVMYKDDSLV